MSQKFLEEDDCFLIVTVPPIHLIGVAVIVKATSKGNIVGQLHV